MDRGFLHGARCLFRGFDLINTPGVRRYILVPLLLDTAIFTLLAFWAGRRFDGWLQHLTGLLPHWLAWLTGFLWLVFAAVLVILLLYVFVFVAGIVGMPFNFLLARRLGQHLDGALPDRNATSGTEMLAALVDEVRRFFYLMGWLLLALLLCILLLFVPLANLLVPALWFTYTAWALSVQYADYPLGIRSLRFHAQLDFLRDRRKESFGFGAAAAACMLVPGLNLIALQAAVAGAMLLWGNPNVDTRQVRG